MRTLTLRTPDVDFHALEHGADPRTVLVHGTGGDLHIWDSLCEAIGTAMPLLRYDLRGFGRTICRDTGSYNHADDLLRLLDALGLERCDLVGVSMGGGVALHFTLNHPERVRRLALISPLIAGWEWPDAWRDYWNRVVERARSGAVAAAKELWWQHPMFATTRESPGASALYESIQRYSGYEWIHDAHEAVMPDVERLHELNTPTLLVSGARDLDDFRLIADLIEASAADVQRVDVPTAGHLVPLEEPEQCAAALVGFFARQAPAHG